MRMLGNIKLHLRGWFTLLPKFPFPRFVFFSGLKCDEWCISGSWWLEWICWWWKFPSWFDNPNPWFNGIGGEDTSWLMGSPIKEVSAKRRNEEFINTGIIRYFNPQLRYSFKHVYLLISFTSWRWRKTVYTNIFKSLNYGWVSRRSMGSWKLGSTVRTLRPWWPGRPRCT